MKYLKALKDYDETHGVRHNESIKRAFLKHERIHSRALSGVYKYRPEVVESAIEFVENEFWKTTGSLELIKLQPVQKWWFELWFGYYTLDDEILINETFLNIIRGAGKSTIMAAVELYWMIYGGNYGGESVVIAYDNNQAEHVFGQVRNQISSGSGLMTKLGDAQLLKTTKTGITFTPNKNEFRKQTNDVHRSQGGNTSLNIFDEVHVYKDDVVSTINKGSRQKQKSWRSLYITSGGIVRGYLYDDMVKRFKSDEEFENDRTIGLIYQLDAAEEVTDELNWSKAAPMIYAGIPSLVAVRDEYAIASGDPSKQAQFLAYNMGLAVQDTAKYILEEETALTDYDFDEVWTGANVVVGIDIGISYDLTAFTFLTEKDGLMFAHVETIGAPGVFHEMPSALAEKIQRMPNFHNSKTDKVTAAECLGILEDFVERTNCNLTYVCYDPARYDMLHELIDVYFFDRDGDRQVKAVQTYSSLSDYIRLMKYKLSTKTLIHNSPMLKWSLQNYAVKIGWTGDLLSARLNDNDKIDPVVALTMALKVHTLKGQY